MYSTDVDFDRPIHASFPSGWQNPREIAEGLIVAAALELQARSRIDRHDPFGPVTFDLIPDRFRYDSFGSLAAIYEPFARLPLLYVVWEFVDAIVSENRNLRETSRDTGYFEVLHQLSNLVMGQHGAALTQVTLNRRWFESDIEPELSNVEQQFIAGVTIPGRPAGILEPNGAFYIESFWQMAFRLIELRTPEFFLDKYAAKTPFVLSILDRGAVRGRAGHNRYQLWPGWS